MFLLIYFMLKRNLVWNKNIIENEKIIKKQEYLKIFFKKFPKKINKIIFNVFFLSKKSYNHMIHIIPKKLLIYRIKDILTNSITKKIKFLVFSRDVSNFELIIWMPILCKIFKIPFFITNSKNLIKKLNKNKTSFIFGVTRDFDKFDKEKQRISDILTKINYEFYFSENLIYY
uniref:Ribosomal protein L7ae n=1 Tax=Lotharella vacuolata TaxID=74820 RepID=A0A0H5BQU0_9EUKA|nr:ribosomal protein L7ae [Lotharella vacuolata]